MNRIIGLDVGDKRIGMAISDELLFTAQPLELYERRGPRQDIAYMKSKLEALLVTDLVVGLPVMMKGEPSTMAHRVTDFADQIKACCAVRVIFWDERLSTVQANRSMLEGDLSRKKRKSKMDVVAAQLILQGYLDSLRIKRERAEEDKRWGRA